MRSNIRSITQDLHDFGKDIHKLHYLVRYNTTPHLFNETVSAHVGQVSILALRACDLIRVDYNIDINKEKILVMAIIHDLGEVSESSGDVPHPVKENNKDLAKALLNAEYEEVRKLIGLPYVEALKEYDNEQSLEALIVHLADVMACWTFADFEVKLGNTHFLRVRDESINRVFKLEKKIQEEVRNRARKD